MKAPAWMRAVRKGSAKNKKLRNQALISPKTLARKKSARFVNYWATIRLFQTVPLPIFQKGGTKDQCTVTLFRRPQARLRIEALLGLALQTRDNNAMGFEKIGITQ